MRRRKRDIPYYMFLDSRHSGIPSAMLHDNGTAVGPRPQRWGKMLGFASYVVCVLVCLRVCGLLRYDASEFLCRPIALEAELAFVHACILLFLRQDSRELGGIGQDVDEHGRHMAAHQHTREDAERFWPTGSRTWRGESSFRLLQ